MRRDLIVSFLSSVPNETLSLFRQRPLQLVSPVQQKPSGPWLGGRQGYRQWLSQFRDGGGNLIPRMFRAAGGSPEDTIGRVCVMGFSNGCIGVDEMLGAADSNRFDVVIACDGIHGSFAPDGGLSGPFYKNWLNHAAHVLQENPDFNPNAPLLCITHSSIVPGSYPSTTQTADLIWRLAYETAPEDVLTLECGFDCPPVAWEQRLSELQWPEPASFKSAVMNKTYSWRSFADGWYDRRIANNLFVFGWGERKDGAITTRDPSGNADHVFQGRAILPTLLTEMVVKRWNADCGLIATAGLGEDAVACRPGVGTPYGRAAGAKVDYFPALPQSIPTAQACPPPPPGYVIGGDGLDPCSLVRVPSLPLPRPEPPSLARMLWFAAPALAGYFATRYAFARWA